MAGAEQPICTFEKSAAEEQAELDAAAAPLIAFRYPAAVFNRDAAINAGFTFKSFLEHVSTIARFAENNQLPDVTVQAVKNNIYPVHTTCTIKQFVDLSMFVKSKQFVDPKDIALERILQIQRQDFLKCLKKEMSEYRSRIAELKAEIRKLESKMNDRKAEVLAAIEPVPAQKKYKS